MTLKVLNRVTLSLHSCYSSDSADDEPNPQEMTLSSLRKQGKPGRADRVHYISLKPFSKKERKRQAAARRAAASAGVSPPPQSRPDGGQEEGDEEEEFVPRSPVPLPDASQCKPILVSLGFSPSHKGKKGRGIVVASFLFAQRI